jgi:hypothetical protein
MKVGSKLNLKLSVSVVDSVAERQQKEILKLNVIKVNSKTERQ